MRKFADWYDGLSPTQHLVIGVVTTLAIATLSAFAHQRIGYRRGRRAGYIEGHVDGSSPLKQVELDAANRIGYRDGWYDGAWANESTAFKKGLEIGASLAHDVRQPLSTTQPQRELIPA